MSLRLRPDDLAWRDVDGAVVVLDLRAASYLRLNATGTLLWLRLLDGATPAELEGTLMTSYGLDVTQARADVDAFVASLRDRALLAEA